MYLKKHHPSSFAGGVLLGITLSPILRDTCEQHALLADGARLALKLLGAESLPLLTKGCLSFGSWRKGEQTVHALEKPRYPPLSSFEEDRTRSVCLASTAASNLGLQLSKT